MVFGQWRMMAAEFLEVMNLVPIGFEVVFL